MSDIKVTKYGDIYIVVEKRGASSLIEFKDEHKHRLLVSNCTLKRNGMKNPFTPSVCGAGYMGVGDYVAKIDHKHTPQYAVWNSMLKRCYSEVTHEYRPTYVGMSVVEEWHNFQVFATWFDEQYKESDWQLDKDILKKGNSVYCPEYCRFVPRDINVALTLRKRDRGEYPLGVSRYAKNDGPNPYLAEVNAFGKKRSLGYYPTVEAAHMAYKKAKEEILRELADMYKDVICPDIYNALQTWEIQPDD